jgi:hypothetical protein
MGFYQTLEMNLQLILWDGVYPAGFDHEAEP